MGRLNSVHRLPAEVRAEIDRRLIENNFSGYIPLAEELRQRGYGKISKSSLHRYGRAMEKRYCTSAAAAWQKAGEPRSGGAGRRGTAERRGAGARGSGGEAAAGGFLLPCPPAPPLPCAYYWPDGRTRGGAGVWRIVSRQAAGEEARGMTQRRRRDREAEPALSGRGRPSAVCRLAGDTP